MSKFTPLEERIKNLTIGLLGMVDGQKVLVNRAFLERVRDDMTELLTLRRAQPANEPLTIDELREMDGEPVWVTHKDGSGGRWGIVNSYKGTGMCADLDSYTAYWFDDWCGTIAYRRKPEPEGRARRLLQTADN